MYFSFSIYIKFTRVFFIIYFGIIDENIEPIVFCYKHEPQISLCIILLHTLKTQWLLNERFWSRIKWDLFSFNAFILDYIDIV